jgi:hypothetical protein
MKIQAATLTYGRSCESDIPLRLLTTPGVDPAKFEVLSSDYDPILHILAMDGPKVLWLEGSDYIVTHFDSPKKLLTAARKGRIFGLGNVASNS